MVCFTAGHSWGSEHDSGSCAPTEEYGGQYLMYPYSVSGYDINNKVSTEVNISCTLTQWVDMIKMIETGMFMICEAPEMLSNFDIYYNIHFIISVFLTMQ